MANLLKFSKSFAMDLQKFISNPKVIEVLAGGFSENAEYFRASGFAGRQEGNAQYFRVTSTDDDTETTSTPPKTGFFSGLNLGNILKDGLNLFGQLDKNKTDREIANAQAQVGANVGGNTNTNTGGNTGGGGKDDDPDTKMSTTTIVILSLVGVAVLGTIIYFVARPKE